MFGTVVYVLSYSIGVYLHKLRYVSDVSGPLLPLALCVSPDPCVSLRIKYTHPPPLHIKIPGHIFRTAVSCQSSAYFVQDAS